MRIKYLYITLLFFIPASGFSQYVYKTPSGEKYHLSSCRMVENVSKRISIHDAIGEYGLEPCKICKPPIVESAKLKANSKNKAVGACVSQRCKGTTKKGTRCKHWTKLCNGYCFQHVPKKPE